MDRRLDKYVTTTEAARMLGLTSGRVRQFVSEGRFPVLRANGRLTLVHISDLRAFARSEGRRLRDGRRTK